jgi:hypothetical protein
MSKPVPLCTHTLPDGHLCGSPALKGRCKCYHHDPDRRARKPLRRVAASVPPLDTAANIQHVLRDAIRLIYQGKLDNRRARNVIALAEKALAAYKAQHRFGSTRPPTSRGLSSDLAALLALLDE